jgi:YVTN family beta-propeller protein
MIVALAISLSLRQADAQRPRRDVPDPGVIATDQRVTPAGVQAVFSGRVTGVRFGEAAGELWVAVPRSAYHLTWADNRVLARGVFDGESGVQGVAIDLVRHRALVTSVGRLAPNPNDRGPRDTHSPSATRAVAQIGAYPDTARGDVASTLWSGALGGYLAGAPAVARTPYRSGRRHLVIPLPADDRLAVLDADDGTLVRMIPLGVAPIAAVVAPDGSAAYVTNFGGPRPGPTERSAMQCCRANAERVRVDARGIAAPGSVVHVDIAAGRVTTSIVVGRHPTALVWDELNARLYVADGNDDAVTVIDTRSDSVVGAISIAPFRERGIGLAPTALALAPDGRTLYVTLGGVNAVAMYALPAPNDSRRAATATLAGLIPTAWYPSSIDVSGDGRYLAVGSLFGVGSGEGQTSGSPGKKGRYVFAERGAVSVIERPTETQLAEYSWAVAANAHLTLAASPDAAPFAPRSDARPRAVPERPGEPSLVRHVVYIVKENRTYDQVLGDLGKGDGDSSLVVFGRDVTPNQHALAERFVTIDRMFASGGNSADGHQWLTQANETEYARWPLYLGRSYPSEGVDPLVYSSGGFLWEAALARGKSVSVFGEYAPSASDSVAGTRAALFAEWRAHGSGAPGYFRELLRQRYDTRSEIPSLDRVLVREYPGWTQEVPDVVKAADVLDHLREWSARGAMPDLVMIILPNDHTVGTSPGWCTPRACVADNDFALGRIVDGLTHSPFWREMAILVIEDDAQNGVDHVDGHRTVALAISPFAKRGSVDHTFYNQPSMVKTVELMLGLPPLSLFDLVATDMRASFIAPGDAPDYSPFDALEPRQSLYETNQRVGTIRGAHAAERRRAAQASARMPFDGPDEAPTEALNRIIWHATLGWNVSYPLVKQSRFFPMSRDIDDDDREERPAPRAGNADRERARRKP